MVSLASQLAKTLKYSAQFDYPLTLDELWYWQIGSNYPKSQIKKTYSPNQRLLKLRSERYKFSQSKWQIASKVSHSLSSISSIEAIFITGALAMNNSPEDDDIDLMIVTTPSTLWLTRLRVIFLLKASRRPSRLIEHSSQRVSNKICDNLYLDSSHLAISSQNLYTAHEVLQAKCIFDRQNISQNFLLSNSWAGEFLPIAYRQSLKKPSSNKYIPTKANILITFLNLLAFMIQYLYMKPKITNEKISLHSAFFHPRTSTLS